MPSVAELVDAFEMEPTGPGRYRASSVSTGRDIVFGGQIMGQAIVAAARAQEAKEVKTLHVIFARAARVTSALEYVVETIHDGKSFGSVTVTAWQGKRLCAQALVLLYAPGDDLIRHAHEPPKVDLPASSRNPLFEVDGWDVRIVGDVDIRNPDEVGPPELRLWTRFGTAPDDPLISQALLAYAADGFLMGTAMRPHRGVGQSQVHSVISTAVISHTITFHEQFRASDWILLDHESPYAGRSITYGRANAFDLTGRLVASFIQDNMVRRFAAGVTVEGAERTVF